ncbi:MAG: hypothetical protein Q9163_003365 [Psora crenata]
MFSNSSIYLGGGNSVRPGGPQYGQPSYLQQPQQQSSSLGPQPTGSIQAPLQQQFTGYPAQGQQQQNLQATPQQAQYSGLPPQQQQPPPQLNQLNQLHSSQAGQSFPTPSFPQKTGQTSSQIAQSFSSNLVHPSAIPSTKSGTKIPRIRLSFLTATDQAKFEQLFKSAVGEGQSLDGETCKELLLRSKLPGSDLVRIWTLSDTTKSGQLLFPEFALAMYLCNLRLVGQDLPSALPERIANEVSSMVDIISFGVPDDPPQASQRANAPDFGGPSSSNSVPNIQQPQPQASNSQLLSQITSQPTGFAAQYIPPQPTGFTNQTLALAPQATGFQHQQLTPFRHSPQSNGFQGPTPPMPPMPSGYGSGPSPPQTGQQPPLPLNAQPTGRPGQWGLVNAPATGLPNIETLQQRMMPQPGREGGFTTAGLSGTATIPWAVTKDEKKIYDQLFRAWDGLNKGFIGGDVAIEVMGQSGLPKSDLERIWTLSDPGNRGRLDMDEFAVAMHLIYRKLNGYPVPNQLPPELVPPSTRNFSQSIDTVKSLLSQDAETRKTSGSFLQPQKTGVSYLKTHSFRTDSNGITPGRKDATIFRHNDDDVGYRSSARRRVGAGGRTPSPAQPPSPVSEKSSEELSIEQLRKRIREKKVLLDAMDFKDENADEAEDALDRRDRREAEELYRRIRRIQEDIDTHPKAALRGVDSGAERRALKRQLQRLTDKLPELASQTRKVERSIADSKLELFRLKDAKAHPASASTIVGTGPGGTVTEGDRLKARARALMLQRSAALTGKSVPASEDESGAAAGRLEEENSKAKTERENNERMIKDVEDSVREFSRTLEDSLAEDTDSSVTEHERRRWEDGLGVEDEVRDFIFDLQRSSEAARVRQAERGTAEGKPQKASSPQETPRDLTPTISDRQPGRRESPKIAVASSGGSYSSYKTAEDRAAFIKQHAEQRMAERMVALGLKPPVRSGESSQQRQEREARERQDRMRQAEEEDSKRESERQLRLASEQPSAPDIGKSNKKPPPTPPVRKNRADSAVQRIELKRKEDDAIKAKAEQEGLEQAIKDQQQAQASETRAIESEAERQEDELEKERQASEARLKALEEQVRQGKIKKQEEKRKRQAAEKEAREREAKVAAQRAELEAAKEKERQLQLQLESIADEDSSDEDGPQETTPQGTTPSSSQIMSRDSSQRPPDLSVRSTPTPNESGAHPSPSDASPVLNLPPELRRSSTYAAETKNPYFRKMNQSAEPNATALSVTSPPTESTNPFHRLAQQQESTKSQALSPPLASTPTGHRPSRVRPEEDEWSVVESTSSSDDDDGPEKPTGGSAKQLASMLFGTMAPPRPLSAMDDKKSLDSPSSPAPPTPSTGAPVSPAPVPAMPGSFDSADEGPPLAPPPPPLPAPNGIAGGPPAPPPPPAPDMPSGSPAKLPDRSGLLNDIQKGKGLRKVQTKDKSGAAIAGRFTATLRLVKLLAGCCRYLHLGSVSLTYPPELQSIYSSYATQGVREELLKTRQGVYTLFLLSHKIVSSQMLSAKASTGEEQDDSKKPRRSQRISSQSQTTPLKDKNKSYLPSPLTHQESTATDLDREPTASPPEGRPSQIKHRSPNTPSTHYTQGGLSSPPPSDTQVFSQFGTRPTTLSHDVQDEDAEGVWGYLVPVDTVFGDTLVLRSRSACPAPFPNGDFARGTAKRAKAKTGVESFVREEKSYEREKLTSGFPAGGYLIGRHPECDRKLDIPTISNRHCIIFNENKNGTTVAVIEDLSSNGTFVNEAIIGRNKRRELENGDEISVLDKARFAFYYPLNRDSNAFRQQYRILQQLGKGHFATVYLCVERCTGTQYAVKKFEKRHGDSGKSQTDGLQQEIGVLKSVSHPNMLCLKDTFIEEDGVYLVLELAPEGELFNYIVLKQKLTEEEARKVFIQLFQGIQYLHERNIVHRDIKPENILLADKDLTIKVADFGLAKIIGEESFTTTLCGTPSYVAPEILENSRHRKYTRAVDVWSLGVVLYICLCGFPPFSDELYSEENPYTLSQQIKMGRFDYPSPYWDSVGDPALDLIDRMLTVDVDKRISVSECLEHPWLTQKYLPSVNDSTDGLTGAMSDLDFSLRKIQRQRTLLADLNNVKVSKVIEWSDNKADVRIFEKNVDGKRVHNAPAGGQASQVAADGYVSGQGKEKRQEEGPAANQHTEVFMEMGGKGDQQLFENDRTSRYERDELPE